MKKLSIQDLCIIAIFAAIIAVMAQIIIPMPLGVPMTLQTLAIMLAGVMLGAKKALISTVLYVLLGAIGAPVFAGFAGGFGIVLGPTGGFIMSFPILALAVGIGTEKSTKKAGTAASALWLWGGIVTGVLLNYLCGVIYFSIYTSNDLISSFVACVLFFIPTDILKIAIAGLLGVKVRRLLMERGAVKSDERNCK